MTTNRSWMWTAGWAAAVIVLMAGSPSPLLAREGLYVGLGSATQTVTGDLDGLHTVDDTANGRTIRLGKLDAGTGISVQGGYGLNRYLGADLMYNRSGHAISFQDGAGDGRTSAPDATLTAILVGARIFAPIAEVFEAYGRLGWGGYRVDYRDNAFAGSTPLGGSEITGSGAYYGLGAEVTLGNFGLALDSLYQAADFDRLRYDKETLALKPKVSVSITTVTLLLTYHFK